MGNSILTGRIINLSVFSSAITIPNVKLFSIEWVNSTTQNHTCTITNGVGGLDLVNWTCTTAKQGITKYFPLQSYSSVDIAIDAVQSGELIILVR
jgi:hypothetical protein